MDSQPLEARTPISVWEVPDLQGLPITVEETERVRSLTLNEVRQKAAEASAIAQAMTIQRNRLECLARARNDACLPNCLWEAFEAQIQFERSVTAQQAADAYMGLVEIYLQHELLEQSRQAADRADRVIQKLQANDLAREIDPLSVTRQRIGLDSHFVDLATKFQQATVGLEMLLNIESRVTEPIWTNYQITDGPILRSREEVIEQSFSARGDLIALMHLQQCVDCIAPDGLSGLGNSLHPLLSVSLSTRSSVFAGLATRDAIDSKRDALRDQICSLVSAKKKQVRLEVERAFGDCWNQTQKVELLQVKLDSLNQSVEQLDRRQEIELVDFKQRFGLDEELRKTRSELVTAVISRERARLALNHASGQRE